MGKIASPFTCLGTETRNRDGKSSSCLSGKALDADKGYRGNKLISSACSGKHSYMLCCRAVCLCDARDLGVCVCACVSVLCACVCVCGSVLCACVCECEESSH